MKKILFIERKLDEFVSIERVFRQVAGNLSDSTFEGGFQKLKFGNSISGIIKNLLLFKKKEADIYHITGHIHYMALVFPRNKTILTIHDLRFLHTKNKIRRFFLKKLFLDWPVRKLKYLTVISESTKKELLVVTKCEADKIIVIENPLDDTLVSNGIVRGFNNECPTILQIGTMENKNIPALIEALEGINCKLRVIGKLNEKQTQLLAKSEICFENRYEINDQEMRSEYENADIIAFCSTYEGFGLPIIESQAMRKPVITSNLSPMREVSGGAAYLADPFDHLSIREGINKIIHNKKYRENLIKRGIENINRFNSESIARKYETLYEEILLANE